MCVYVYIYVCMYFLYVNIKIYLDFILFFPCIVVNKFAKLNQQNAQCFYFVIYIL